MENIHVLIQNGTFELASVTDIAKETRISGSRFIDSTNAVDNGRSYKSRLLAQNYGDKEAETTAKKPNCEAIYPTTYAVA